MSNPTPASNHQIAHVGDVIVPTVTLAEIEATQPLQADPFIAPEAVLAVAMHAEAVQANEVERMSGAKRLGRVAVAEGIGLMLDGGRIALGIPAEAAEPLLSAVDGMIIGKAIEGHAPAETEPVSRRRRAGRFLGHAATNALVAIGAQKAGVAGVDAINPALNHGLGEYIVPITAKFAGISAALAAKKFAKKALTANQAEPTLVQAQAA